MLKLVNVLLKKEHRAESDQGSWFSHRSEKCAKKNVFLLLLFFDHLVFLIHVTVY